MKDWHISREYAEQILASIDTPFAEIMRHGTMTVELYRPVEKDYQLPHKQDELYYILSGTGMFLKDGSLVSFKAGDVLFVEAGIEHRFEKFSNDFETLVIFWGPEGGEK